MDFLRKKRFSVIQVKQAELSDGSVLPLLYYPMLEEQKWLSHCFTTRLGGVSEGIFSQLNLSFTRGDDRKAVKENFRRLAEALGTEPGNFVFSDQTHTTNVRKVTRQDAGNGLTREKSFFDTDGLITDEPGLVLSTFYADCVPLYFVDPVRHAIGLSHSGWRGTVGRMGKATVEAMAREYGSRPEELLCAIGPSICQDCYEVGEDVAEEFRREFAGGAEAREVSDGKARGIWDSSPIEEILYKKDNGKYQLDLWRANEIILAEAGVRREHIVTTDICTCCNSQFLFSHRASQGKRGNLGAFMMIMDEKGAEE